MEINLMYLESTGKVKDVFNKEGVIILNSIFEEKFFDEIKSKIKKLKFSKDFELLHHNYNSNELNLDSKELKQFLSKIINKKIKKLQFKVLKLTWKDYQILNDKYLEKPGVDVVIDVTKNWDDNWGGLFTYIDGSGNYAQVPSSDNSLAIVKRKKGNNRFIQYVNHYGRNKERIVLIATL